MEPAATCALLLAIATAAAPEAHQGILGSYVGEVWSGSGDDRGEITTVIEETPAGLGGCYVAEQAEGTYEGKLTGGEPLGGGHYRFTWQDRYGRDVVVFAFAAEPGSFVGKWFVGGVVAGGWTGHR